MMEMGELEIYYLLAVSIGSYNFYKASSIVNLKRYLSLVNKTIQLHTLKFEFT